MISASERQQHKRVALVGRAGERPPTHRRADPEVGTEMILPRSAEWKFPSSRWLRLVCAGLLLCLSPFAFGRENLVIPEIGGVPALEDFADMEAVTPLARSMALVENFIQREPDDGESASQRTEVYLGYNRTELHVVFLAFDSEPEGIRANLSSRENIDGDDSVAVTLDTFNDQRAAFTFRSTPLGVQWDARWTENASDFDTTFEAVWNSEGRLTDEGYMVRMAIPLRSLRFPDTLEQTWRVQLARNVSRLSEWSYWPRYTIDIEGRLNQAALLNGIREVSPGNNYQIVPFLFAREANVLKRDMTGGPGFEATGEQELGVDAKFVFNDSMALDVTLNPDFSQIESDEPQVTVNERFEVQFPERRPFFVENADFFATDSTLVFTRRIIDPEGGLRFTGRSGDYGFGGIVVNDIAPGRGRADTDPLAGEKANIAILRGFRDFGEQDRYGFLVSDRKFGDGYNRVASIDGRIKLSENWIGQLQVIGSETEPYSGDGETYAGVQRNFQINHAGRNWNTQTHLVETSPGFRTDLGFMSRFFRPNTSDMRQRIAYTHFPEDIPLNRMGVAWFGVYLEDWVGTKVFHQNGPMFEVATDTTQLSMGWTGYNEILRPGDYSGLMVTQNHDYDDWQIRIGNNSLNTLEFGLGYRWGSTLNLVPNVGTLPYVADHARVSADALWRPTDRLRINNTYLYTEVQNSAGARIFSNEIIRSNWNYQFTREWSLRFITQYEETTGGPLTRLEDERNLNFDLLLRYVINPWSAFYVGYNSNSSNFEIVDFEGERELVNATDLRRDGDQLFVKFSYLFQR